MTLLRGPVATASVMNSVIKHQNKGEIVVKIFMSARLNELLVMDAWEWAQYDIGSVKNIMNIPVVIEPTLRGTDFFVEVEKGNYRND